MYFSLQLLLLFHFLSSVHLTNVNIIPNGTVDVIEHQINEFHCVLSGLSTAVRWFINSTLVQETRNITMPNSPLISFYEYVGSKTDLGKTIHCEATYGETTFRSIKATLNIIYGPERGQPSLDVGYKMSGGVPLGWPFHIRCYENCNPPCTHTWLRWGSLITTNENLTFDALKKEDGGTYECVVRNVITNLEAHRFRRFTVVYGPEKAELHPDKYVYTIPEFTSVVITCHPINCKPGCYMSRWYKNDDRNTMFEKVDYSGEVQILMLINIQRSDAGNYSCYVANRVDAKTSHAVEINVIYGPENSTSIYPPSATVLRSEGLPLNPIRCSADCYPPCQYQWLKNSNIVVEDQTLSIDAIKKTDNGNYTCRAWNEAGEEFINITLAVTCNLESYSPSSPRLSFPEGIGTGAGGVLLVVIIILTIFIVNKERKKKPLRNNSTGYDETHNTNRESNVYDEIKVYSKDTNRTHQDVGSQQNS